MKAGQENQVAPARPSATIVVLRQADALPELLLVKRRAGDAFGESYAFPGGVVDHDESAARRFATGVTDSDANLALGLPRGALDYYSAGIRELFEETGVLLAHDETGCWACDKPEFATLRTKVDRGLMPWSDFLSRQHLAMACDALHYFAHWETPLEFPKRWSTRFFAAELPPGQIACHDGVETTDSCWLTAAEALERSCSGLIDVPYPTIKTLEMLQRFNAVAEVLAWARDEQSRGIGLNRLDSLGGVTR